MQQSLLDRLVELIKLDYPEDWGPLCDRAHATEPSVSPEEAARRRLRGYSRRYDLMASSETTPLCKKFIEHFADVFRNQFVGRIKGSVEAKSLEPALIRPEALRFDPDELVLDKGELVIVDVRVEPAPAHDLQPSQEPPTPAPLPDPVRKLNLTEWVHAHVDYRGDELAAKYPNVTAASHALAEESRIAPDCAKADGWQGRSIENELRNYGLWPKVRRVSLNRPRRHSSKQRPPK
jgi:hypothetical protein